ncbi:hypothetical protein [Sodalis sp.]
MTNAIGYGSSAVVTAIKAEQERIRIFVTDTDSGISEAAIE